MLVATVGQAAGSAVEPATDAAIGIIGILKRKYDYVKKLDNNFHELEKAEKDLDDRKDYVNGVIERTKVRKKEKPETITWLGRVATAKEDITTLKTRYGATKKCCFGLCPFRSLLNLSKDILKKTKEINDLKGKMEGDESIIMTVREPVSVVKMHPVGIKSLQSLHEKVDTLLDYLKDKNVRQIGVWGYAGIGKTTVLKTLNDELEYVKDLFDVVIWITVTKDCRVGTIQQAIVERLNLDVVGINTDQQHKDLISQELVNKKYLLILDEVFENFNLDNVGINRSHEHGKWVLASRCRTVCEKMKVDEYVEIGGLSNKDALQLFSDVVGRDALLKPRLKAIAEQLLIECGGHPQLIETIASTLRDESSEDIWRAKLRRLRQPTGCKLEGMDALLRAFDLAYDELNEISRNCLKYGAFYPEDYQIFQDYLIECWQAHMFFPSVSKLTVARQEGHYVLKGLKGCGMFVRCETVNCVKVPTIYRKFARDRYQENELLVLPNEGNEDNSSEVQWEQAKMIMVSNLQNVPESPQCQTASTFLLQDYSRLLMIPNSFFDFMCGLKVLDLKRIEIESLPPSISNLISLKALYLNDCLRLVSLPTEIKELRDLEVLDIRCTGIVSLPIEIGVLSNLRCLRVSFTRPLSNQNHVGTHPTEMIPSNLIGRLSLLEELTVEVTHDEPGWNRIVNNIASEVATLCILNSLCFCFPRETCFQTFNSDKQSRRNIPVTMFRSFNIQVGFVPHNSVALDISHCTAERHLRFSAGRDSPADAIKEALKEACSFHLIGHQSVRSLSDFGMDGSECLEVCSIEECIEMETVLGHNMTAVPNVLPFLRELCISGLHKLTCIWEASMLGILAKLTILELNNCSSMRKIFSWRMTQQLPNLKDLTLKKCSQLVEVIEEDPPSSEITQVDNPPEAFPKLKILKLIELPILTSICKDDSLKWASLKQLEIKECQVLRYLSLSTTNATQLRSITCKEDWWGQVVFQDNEVKQHLQGRCHFIQ